MSEERPNQAPSKSILEKISQLFSTDPKDREELLNILKSSTENGIIAGDSLSIIQGAMQVADMQVREIMIPRTQMVVVKSNQAPKEFLPAIIESAHSRFPVIGENPDEVLGILLAKDLLPIAVENKSESVEIKELIRPVTFVPESKRLNVLLKEFRTNRNHMAIVINEYGGIAGLVTIEDVLEQIVGEIEDEHDMEDDYLIKPFNGSSEFVVKALTPVDEFNEHFKSDFSDEEFDTIGGLVMNQFGHLPQRDEAVQIGAFNFHVLNADNRSIRLLKVKPEEQAQLEV